MKNQRFKYILLDTDKMSKLFVSTIDNKTLVDGIVPLTTNAKHLYILDTQVKPKVGDYAYEANSNRVFLLVREPQSDGIWNKVIATSDEDLNIMDGESLKQMNQIQPDFIKALVSKLNNKEDVVIDVKMAVQLQTYNPPSYINEEKKIPRQPKWLPNTYYIDENNYINAFFKEDKDISIERDKYIMGCDVGSGESKSALVFNKKGLIKYLKSTDQSIIPFPKLIEELAKYYPQEQPKTYSREKVVQLFKDFYNYSMDEHDGYLREDAIDTFIKENL